MSPEERRQTAFEVFDDVVVTEEVDDAIRAAAEEAGLRSDVVRLIVTKAFGDLRMHQIAVRLRRKNDEEHGRFLQKISEYVEQFHVRSPDGKIPPAAEWVAGELGRPLSPEEDRLALERHVRALNLSLKRDLEKILKDVDFAKD